MLRRSIWVCALAVLPLLGGVGPTWAEGKAVVPDTDFTFEGPLGRYDTDQLRRGLQVYTEVCSSCHGMKLVPLRTLSNADGPALTQDEVRAYAAELEPVLLPDGTERPREITDNFPARVGEGMGPDMSLLAKARAGFHGPYGLGINQMAKGMGGPEYIVALLNGYTGEEKEEAGAYFYENTAYELGWIAMPQPLYDDQVVYEDGSPTDLRSVSEDVTAYLMWAAEPHLGARKSAGLTGVGMLLVLAALLYLTNKRLWAKVKRPPEA